MRANGSLYFKFVYHQSGYIVIQYRHNDTSTQYTNIGLHIICTLYTIYHINTVVYASTHCILYLQGVLHYYRVLSNDYLLTRARRLRHNVSFCSLYCDILILVSIKFHYLLAIIHLWTLWRYITVKIWKVPFGKYFHKEGSDLYQIWNLSS